jgi:multidrug resistance protein MdtO
MTAIARPRLLGSRRFWWIWLRREMIAYPGRWPMTIRLVVAVVLITVTSMALQIPQLAFSAFFAFFVTKENRVLTTITGLVMIAGVTTATVLTLLLYTFTFDYPELRVPVMAGLIFAGMFLARTFVIGPLGFVIGFFSALVQTVTETSPDTDILVRSQLWLWAAIVYPIALTVLINQVLLPANPWAALVGSLRLRLHAASEALSRVVQTASAGGQTNQPLLDLATRGCTIMMSFLTFAEKQDAQIKRRHPFLVETIAAAGHLVSATASLEFREAQTLSADDHLCAKQLLADIQHLETLVAERTPVVPPRLVPLKWAELPQLRELQFAAESMRDSLIRGVSEYSSANAPAAGKSLFRADAFTNPSHVRFALKVTLGAMICYLVYSGLEWPGISTAFVTCCFVALGNTGATIYKGWLRLFGCLLGGLLGYGAIFFCVPHMESITSLVLLTAVASLLFGWISAGSERIAYAGLQAAFAFYLCLFQGFEPGTNLTIARDRLVGILLGTVVSAVVFRHIWPEHAIDDLRATLGRVLRNVSKLALLPRPGVPMQADGKQASAVHAKLAADLDAIFLLSEQATVERIAFRNAEVFAPAVLEHLTAHIQALALISTALLRRTKVEEWQQLDPSVQSAEFALRRVIAEYLQDIASSIELQREPMRPDWEPALTEWNRITWNISGNDRPRLVNRLVTQCQHLI